MELFTYLMAKNDHNTSVKKDLFSYLLGKNQSGTYTDYSGTSLSINNTKKAKMEVNLLGNTSQTGTPTPDNPIPVNVVSGDNEVVVCGKNLTNIDTYKGGMVASNGTLYENSGISSFTNQNGVITFTTTETYKGTFGEYIPVEPNTKYKLSYNGLTEGVTYFGFYNWYDKDKTFISRRDIGASIVNSPANAKYLVIFLGITTTGTASLKEVQVELGDTATTYEPYQSSTYPVNLPVENLFEFGNQTFTRDKSFSFTNGIPAGTYTFSANITSDETTKPCQVVFYNGNFATVVGQGWLTPNTGDRKNFTFTSNSQIDKAILRSSDNYADSDSKNATYTDVQLEPGDKANSYTPYGTTPIELCKIGTYQDKFIRNSGNNYFNLINDNLDASWDGGDSNKITIIDSGSSTLQTTANYYNWRAKCIKIPNVKANTTYTLSFNVISSTASPSQITIVLVSYDGSTRTNITTDAYTLGKSSKTFTTPSNITDLGISISSSTAGTSVISEIMINEGDTALPYEPYGNGDWYLEKHIRHLSLAIADMNNSDAYPGWTDVPYLNQDYPGKNQRFDITTDYLASITTEAENALQINTTGTLSILFFRTQVYNMTQAEWKTNYPNLILDLYYLLPTPTYTKIEGTLKDELEAVWRAYSYKGTTNINQVNNDLPFELNVSVKVGS